MSDLDSFRGTINAFAIGLAMWGLIFASYWILKG